MYATCSCPQPRPVPCARNAVSSCPRAVCASGSVTAVSTVKAEHTVVEIYQHGNTTDLVPITSRHGFPVGALSATATGVPASVFAEIGLKRDGSGRDISQSNAR